MAVASVDRLKRTEVSGRRRRRHGSPQLSSEANHEVYPTGRDIGCPQTPERCHRLSGIDARPQIELQEVMGMRALSEDPELWQDELRRLCAHRHLAW
jgi:hypothetical protein